MQYRILAIDIDNTLLQGLTGVSKGNREALLRAEEAGCRVVLCTARGRYSTRPVLAEFGPLSGPHIVFNGAATFSRFDDHPDEVLVLDRELLREHGHAAAAIGVGLSGFEDPRAGDRVYVDHPNEGLRQWSAANPERVVRVGSTEEVIERDLVALLCWGTEAQAHSVRDIIGAPAAFSPPRVAPALQFGSYLLEVTAAGATKGEALARLSRDLGIPRDAVIAVGDAEPDIGMIRFAGLGVAVENAKEDVRAAADYVAPPCSEDAVAHIVERFILGSG